MKGKEWRRKVTGAEETREGSGQRQFLFYSPLQSLTYYFRKKGSERV